MESEVHGELLYLIKLAAKDEDEIQSQVYTLVGYIDILTPEEIIEIQVMHEWIFGVGQLLGYAQQYPERTLMLHLFEHLCSIYMPKYQQKTVEKICLSDSEIGIKVSFQDREHSYKLTDKFDNVVPLFACCAF